MIETLLVLALTIVLSSLVIEGAFTVYDWFVEKSNPSEKYLDLESAPDFDQRRYFRDGK